MDGFVIMDKAPGITSFRAASSLRKIYNEKKAGHTGTLDPLATGVLPIALGRASRFIPFLPDSDKAYYAGFRLGLTTDTLDITGKILTQNEVNVGYDEVLKAVTAFEGRIEQLPPMYSAILKDGIRLYELARKGIEVEREKRWITIYDIRLTDGQNGEYFINVHCSKGTYIRTLIDDIGEKLGCGAVMTSLRRTLSNGFSVENALTEEAIKECPEKAIMSIDEPFRCYPGVTVSAAQAKRFSNGGDLMTDRLHTQIIPSVYRVYSPEQVFLGLGEISEDNITALTAKRILGK